MVLSIRAQIERMRRDWPDFRVLGATDWYVSWEGPLQPLAMRYTVRVSMCFDKPLSNAVIVGYAPRVKVVDPLLRRRSEEPREPIPHIYPNKLSAGRPILCLYLPGSGEWSVRDAVADTTVPWAIDWLACYEGWLATGEWAGGGVHPAKEQAA